MASLRKLAWAHTPLGSRARDLREALESIDETPGMFRWLRLWFNQRHLLQVATDACTALEKLEQKDGLHDKLRRSLQIAVTAMGGPSIDWKKQKAKAEDD